jgi:Tfp pilus assembly protein PilO
VKKKKFQLPILIVLAGLGYGVYLFYEFATEVIPKLEARLADKEAAVSGKNAELRRLRTFSENIEGVKLALRELNVQLETALESMPRNYDLSGLLRKLSVIGFNSGIEMSAFRPSPTAVKEGDFYETSVVSFNLAGSFTQIMSFFDQTLRLKRIIRIEKVTLRSVASANVGGPAARGNTGVGSQAEVSAKLYRFVE